MGLLVVLILVLGVYKLVLRARNREVPEEARQFGARIGRTAQGIASVQFQATGLGGQTAADLLPQGPIRESIGPEETHTLVLDASGRPIVQDELAGPSDLGPYRDPDAAQAAAGPKAPGKRKAKAKKKKPATT